MKSSTCLFTYLYFFVSLIAHSLLKCKILFFVEEVESLNVVKALETRTEIGEEDVGLGVAGAHVREVGEEGGGHVLGGPAPHPAPGPRPRLLAPPRHHLHLELELHGGQLAGAGRRAPVLRLCRQLRGEMLLEVAEAGAGHQGGVPGGEGDLPLGPADTTQSGDNTYNTLM